jgi:predicted PurR-regulated permease PerM
VVADRPSPQLERPPSPGSRRADDAEIALVALIAGAVALAVLLTSLALWKGRVVVLLVFLAYTLAAAIRPTVERLVRAGVPRWLAIAVHVAVFAGAVGLLLWAFVPVVFDQTQHALSDLPNDNAGGGRLDTLKQRALSALERDLSELSDPSVALSAATKTLAAVAGIAFTLASAVYWLTARDRLVGVALTLVPAAKREAARDTWLLIDLKLGAVIRTKLALVLFTTAVLSVAFWLIGLPYFLLIAAFAGIVEIVPVIGPLLAGLAAVGAGFTESWQLALLAAACVYGLRVIQDYFVIPRLFGRAVDLPPLVVLVVVSAIALLLGPWWVPLAIPIAAVISTLIDVVVRDRDAGSEPVPTVVVPTDDTVRERRRAGAEHAVEGQGHG